MTVHHTWISLLYFLCYFSTFSNSYVLLYHTENSSSLQYYDCMYYAQFIVENNIQGVKYCRQLNESQPLHRDFNQSCHNGGVLWSFEELSLLNISVSDVLRWSSSIEQVDRYSKYLFNNSLDVGDKNICNCTNPSSFGELDDKTDFLCLCPRCHHGQICEFSNELMSFTLDSLTVKDIRANGKLSVGVYISITFLILVFGLFNNLSSFLTFVRPKSRKFGVGIYLLIVSVINQCSLLFLLLKIIHIILGSNGTLFYYESFNLYSCKIISYLLSVFTRITNWLESLVTLERLCTVLFPTSITFKKPRIAFGLSIFVILVVSGMHVHEAMHYTTIVDPSYTSANITLCVTSYVQQLISVYNRVNVLIHYFAPFAIQVVSITIFIILIARSRARANKSSKETFIDLFKKQFKTHKEHYITPIIIVLSSLPQTILSFSYACTEPKQSWQRYMLLTTYFLSYLPQMLGFILYVLPSTTYTEEFYQTVIGKRLARRQRRLTAARQQNIKTKTRLTKSTVANVVSS